MVIVSNEWIKHSDEQKSMTAPNNALMMAAVGENNFDAFKNDIDASTVKAEEMTQDVDLARIVLLCQPNSHPFQTRTILLEPNVEYKVGRSIAKSRVCEDNATFDCKVLSRNHAVLWYSDGKFYVKDTKSSNGTFINERKIGQSESVELSSGDVVKFGVDVIENSRKEVHGCIIACVKLYMPDGRESISISSTNRPTAGGDNNISFDELHRLYHFIQETTQREKQLESKLHDLQNVLDVTRKGASSCWQAMIDEDRLLNRIDILEKKLHLLQKNCSENDLKSEILKMQDEKYLYQNTAKEALRKVYQEQLEAVTKLNAVERALCGSENECSLLREQILYTQQSFQDVNSRMLILETEFKEYKEQADVLLEEAKVHQSDCNNLRALLEAKDQECEEYREQIKLLMSKNILEPTAVENEKSPNEDDKNERKGENDNYKTKATIMKWLENSNINQSNESKLILNAICNTSDASDEAGEPDYDHSSENTGAAESNENDSTPGKLVKKLLLIQSKLDCLESELLNEINRGPIDTQSQLNDKVESEQEGRNADVPKDRNNLNNEPPEVFIKSTISVLQEAFKDISQYIQKPTADKSTSANEEEDYRKIVKEANEEIEKLKMDIAEKSMEIQNIEQDSNEMEELKLKMIVMEEEISMMKDENQMLNLHVKEYQLKRDASSECQEVISTTESDLSNSSAAIDQEKIISEELAAINDKALQHEEELVLFKEKYDTVLSENLLLKNKIDEFETKHQTFLTENYYVICMYGAIVIVSILFYFLLR